MVVYVSRNPPLNQSTLCYSEYRSTEKILERKWHMETDNRKAKFERVINFIISQEKGSFIHHEKALIQTYHSPPDNYQGLIEMSGEVKVVYYMDKEYRLALRFKRNDDEDIAYKTFCFKPHDKLVKLLDVSEEYEAAKDVYEFFMKL